MSKVKYINPAGKQEFVKRIGYSEAAQVGNLLYTAGQVGLDEKNEIVKGGLKEQTRQAFKNLKVVIEEAGGAMGDIVHLTIFMADKDAGKPLHEAYDVYLDVAKEFLGETAPAAAAVRVKDLYYPELVIEIQAIVAL